MLADLRDLGIAFVSLAEALDFTASAGRAMIGLLSVFAEFERDMIRERLPIGLADFTGSGGLAAIKTFRLSHHSRRVESPPPS